MIESVSTPLPASLEQLASDRRGAERLSIDNEIRGEIVVCQALAVREIGRNGALIETPFPLQVDSLHELRLAFGDCSVVLRARVVHSRIHTISSKTVLYRSGVEFTDVPERVQSVISTCM